MFNNSDIDFSTLLTRSTWDWKLQWKWWSIYLDLDVFVCVFCVYYYIMECEGFLVLPWKEIASTGSAVKRFLAFFCVRWLKWSMTWGGETGLVVVCFSFLKKSHCFLFDCEIFSEFSNADQWFYGYYLDLAIEYFENRVKLVEFSQTFDGKDYWQILGFLFSGFWMKSTQSAKQSHGSEFKAFESSIWSKLRDWEHFNFVKLNINSIKRKISLDVFFFKFRWKNPKKFS